MTEGTVVVVICHDKSEKRLIIFEDMRQAVRIRHGCSLLASSGGAKPFPGFQNFIYQNAAIFLIPTNDKGKNHF